METRKPSQSALEGIAKGAGVVAATGLATAAGWTLWSALFVNHRRVLPPAIDARRYVTATPLAGRLCYYADESASGRPLLLIHSVNAAASSFEMRPIFDRFRTQRPVFALDLPGFGFSERGDREYSPDFFVQALLDFIDGELDTPGGIDIAALSLSCEFVALAALEQPDIFHSLAFIAPTGFGQDTINESERVHRALSFPLWSQAMYDLLVTEASIAYYLRKAFAGPVDSALKEYAYLTSHRPGARHAPFYFLSGKLFTPDILSAYAQLTHPVLALCDNSGFGTSDLLPAFAKGRGNWEFCCFEGMKAMPQFEQPDQTFQAMEDFYAGMTVRA